MVIYIIIFSIILVIWLVFLSYFLYQTKSHYQKLTRGAKKENLIEILENIISKLKDSKTEIEEINTQLQILNKKSIDHVQKIGILRFNPFADTGGDQSFILSILDGHDNGIVLTSLHSRGTTRWYAKNVKEGKGVDHQLSQEEQLSIKQAEKFQNQKKSGLDKIQTKS